MARVNGPRPIKVRPLLTAKELSRVLGVGERTIWRMTSRSRGGSGAGGGCEEFPRPVRISVKAVRWRWQDIDEYLRKQARK